MSPTPRQRSARLTEQINRRRKEIERLGKQKVESKRAERNHRLIVSAATIEAVAHERGNVKFEINEKLARKWRSRISLRSKTRREKKSPNAMCFSP